ncbi:MAG: phosphopentomutase [Clostridia bacterium]|nr:phosphopentomutase [Clostridia bacterium]
MLNKAILIVLDSAGVGHAPDAAAYGDEGANTIGHIAENTHLDLPNMRAIGLGHIPGANLPADKNAAGAFGRLTEASSGKDTTTGHWEIAGIKLESAFPTYPDGFPKEVMDAFEQAIGRGTLGNKPASGTAILQELGEEHIKTGKVIVYTSADSVFQIAAHEEIVPVEELYDMCRKARAILQGKHAVGRVIARPFVGTCAADFKRTGNRHDFSLEPIAPTMLDALSKAGFDSLAVGKIEDIFCMRGITDSVHSAGNPACLDSLMQYMQKDFKGLCFVNLVDFDMTFGHRRDVEGYAQCLRDFDAFLPRIQQAMGENDLLLITADHGCDPTYKGTDHTRERVPILAWHKGMKKAVDLGTRDSYADIAATICEGFGLEERFGANSFYSELELN